ncbi:MAG: Mobile element protein [Candidatus Woesebacteria bacterium]|nr:MAG: Mobile element protein [Candidatus Woesebacteria bacterium]
MYRWRKRLKQSGGKLSSLIPLSKAPKRKRQMMVNPKIVDYIAFLRENHPCLGKRKIKPLLDKYCRKNNLTPISVSTTSKVIKRHNLFFQKQGRIYHSPSSGWAKRRRLKDKRQRVRYSPKVKDFGYLEIDTVVMFLLGMKFYVYNTLDVKLKFKFALAFKKANVLNTLDFFRKLKKVYPLKDGIKIVQTDNGSEYLGAFHQHLNKMKITHLFIYPRCPKINSFVERANRTLKEEFLNEYQDLALTDISLLNQELVKYLIWYNTQRPHEALNYKSPIDYLLEVSPESQMYLTRT